MTGRSLSGFALLSTLVVLLAPGVTQAASCKTYKETSGCKLPDGTSYQYTNSETDEMNATVDRGKAQLVVRSACVQQRRQVFKFKSVPKVGRTYTFTSAKTKVSELQDGITVTYTYKVDLKIKIASATKATTTGTASITAPAVPPQDSFGGEDAFNSTCKLSKTLKRSVLR